MSILDTAAEVAQFLDDFEVPYAVIGGLAVQYWGEARNTRDVDVVVLVSPDKSADFLDAAVRRFRPRIPDAISFAEESRVLLLCDEGGTPVDISLGIPGYEDEVISRAVDVAVPGKRSIRLISVEDLIIHKCVAGRPRDQEDIEGILERQRMSVDMDYIRRWLEQFAPLIDDHDVVGTLEGALERAHADLGGMG